MARAERGFWNGAQFLRYDLNLDSKGYLMPNEKERTLADSALDAYLQFDLCRRQHKNSPVRASTRNRATFSI